MDSNDKLNEYEVMIYFSSFCTYKEMADNEVEAVNKARRRSINEVEIMANLENWLEADEIVGVVRGE